MLKTRVSLIRLPRWRSARQLDAAVPVLLVLPWLLLAADPRWVYGSLYRDAWIYFGFFQDLPGHLRAYPDFYGCSRLSVTLPGWLACQLLPPVAANIVLHLAVYSAAVFAGYSVFARVGGRRVGLLVAVLLGGHPFFLKAAGWDYVDGFVIAYYLLAQAALARAAESERWRTWALLAGAAAGAMAVANLAHALLVLPLVAWFVVLNRRPLLAAAGWFALGAGGLLILLGLVSAALGGRFFFLAPSWNFVANYTTGIARMYVHPPCEWVGGAVWLVFPAAACLGAVVASVRRSGMRFVQWHLLAAAALLLAAQYQGRFGYLEVWYYSSVVVMVPAFAALAGQWAGRLDGLSLLRYGVLLAVACGVGLLAAAASRFGVAGPSWLAPVALGCGAAAVLLPVLPRAGFRAAVAAVALFGLLNVGVQARFRMADAMPGVAPVLRLEACQAFDPHRKACFLAIHDAARWARDLDGPGRVWFWYQLHEPLGPVYDMVAHTHCTYYRVIGWEFPLIREGKLADGRPVDALAAGATIVVFCERDEAKDEAVRELRARGVSAEVVGERALGRRPPALIRAFVLRVVP
jgi:hypothetical protein